jgi:dimethylamine/trimethylamine dehydrogenase
MTMSPIRCTQNPTMGEEWRRGWHPERIAPKASDTKVLVVGGGPAGLECARALGARGYQVALAEAGRELGGRVARECRLPGLSAWGRVRDHRLQQLTGMANVETYLDSRLSAEQILEFGFQHVAIATGALWRRDGVARFHVRPFGVDPSMELLTPDDLMDAKLPSGQRVVLYDDDHYYMGGVLAELLVGQGRQVTLVTPAANVSNWTYHTLEQGHIQTRLLELGIAIEPHRAVTAVHGAGVETACVFTGRKGKIACDAVVLVTARLPSESLYRDLLDRRQAWANNAILSVKAIGDAFAPGIIAAAVYAGHRYARELDGPEAGDDPPFKRELTELAAL